MDFVLFKKLAELEGTELIMLIAAVVLFIALVVFLAVRQSKKKDAPAAKKQLSTRILVQGALCICMAFILSYIKLFSMPLGGSITLCSMLPIVAFAYLYGPAYGFTAAFAYSLLQIVQGAYVVHPIQFVLDYFVAFTCLGMGAFFKKRLWLGMAVAGTVRMITSIVSGVVFFSEYAAEAGYTSAVLYSVLYNLSTIGAETVLCVAASLIPAVRRAIDGIKKAA